MSSHEWYRNTNWDPAIESQFFERLNQSKGNKWQYLKVQIHHLLNTGNRGLDSKIFQLLKILFEETKNSPNKRLSAVHEVLEFLDLLSNYYWNIGDVITTLQICQYATRSRYAWIGYDGSWISLKYGELVVIYGQYQFYNEILDLILGELKNHTYVFPVLEYRANIIVGGILHYEHPQDAILYLGKALQYSSFLTNNDQCSSNVIVEHFNSLEQFQEDNRKKIQNIEIDPYWFDVKLWIDGESHEKNWKQGGEEYLEKEQQGLHEQYILAIEQVEFLEYLQDQGYSNLTKFEDISSIGADKQLIEILLEYLSDNVGNRKIIPSICNILGNIKLGYQYFDQLCSLWEKWISFYDYDIGQLLYKNIQNHLKKHPELIEKIKVYIRCKDYGEPRWWIIFAFRRYTSSDLADFFISLLDDDVIFLSVSQPGWKNFWRKNKPDMIDYFSSKEQQKRRNFLEKQRHRE